MDTSLEGKVALITGGSRGIGRAIGAAFAAAGATVVLSSRKQGDLDAAAAEVADATGATVVGLAANAGDPEATAAVCAATAERFGGLDILVNNAATNPYMGSIMGISPAQMDKTTQVNQRAIVTWAQEAVKAGLGARPGAAMLNVSSIGGLTVERDIAYYNVTKAAVLHLTRQLAAELAPRVRVNAVCPGLVKTDFARALWEAEEAALSARNPLGRLGEPEDVADAALFLCSGASSWITGEHLVIDGGTLLGGGVG